MRCQYVTRLGSPPTLERTQDGLALMSLDCRLDCRCELAGPAYRGRLRAAVPLGWHCAGECPQTLPEERVHCQSGATTRLAAMIHPIMMQRVQAGFSTSIRHGCVVMTGPASVPGPAIWACPAVYLDALRCEQLRDLSCGRLLRRTALGCVLRTLRRLLHLHRLTLCRPACCDDMNRPRHAGLSVSCHVNHVPCRSKSRTPTWQGHPNPAPAIRLEHKNTRERILIHKPVVVALAQSFDRALPHASVMTYWHFSHR